MKKRILALLLALTLTFPFDTAVCFAEPVTETPYTEAEKPAEAVEEHIESTEKMQAEEVEEALKTESPEASEHVSTFVSGVIPDNLPAISIHNENEDNAPAARSVQLPAQYDSRDSGCITAVRDQNPFGTCWAFGAIASGEASLLKKGLATADSLDLSERHLAYFFYHPAVDPLGNTAGDSITPIGDDYLNLGGNNLFTTFALAAWKGAAAEQTAPYSELVESYYKMDTSSFFSATDLPEGLAYADAYHMQNSYWIPMTDRNDIKKMIMEYGAMSISYFHDDSYLNPDTSAYYSDCDNPNHVVTIVGWDDNYSRSNFLTDHQPQSNGAWLVRNSWNTWFGKDGYFWISYEEAGLNQDRSKGFVYDFEPADNYDNNYQYDGSAGIYCDDLSNGGSIGNIFKATANPGGTETLKAVSFALNDTNVNYSIQVYRNLDSSTDPTSGIPALSKPVTGKTSYVGYYTVPLEQELPLAENSLYSVVVQFTKDNGDDIWYMVDATYQNGDWIRFTNAVSPGQSFEKDTANGSWEDLSEAPYYCSARLKAFTNNSSVSMVTGISLDKTSMKLNRGEAYTLKSAITPASLNTKVLWTSSNPQVAAADENGKVTAKAGGRAVITAQANDGSGKKAFCEVIVPFKITYQMNGGKNHSANPTSYYNEEITLKNPTRDEYIFLGWYLDSAYKNKITTITGAYNKDLALYARWTDKYLTLSKTTLTLKKNKTYSLGKKLSFAPSSAKVVWSTSNKKIATVGSSGKVTAKAPGTATITATLTDANGNALKNANGKAITATCKVTVPYTITYKLNGGKNNASNPTSYYKQKIVLKKPVRSGYTFKGWYKDSKYKNKITTISASSKKNLKLYAKWAKVTVKTSSIQSLKNSKPKQIAVSCKKVSGASGYQILYSTDKNFKSKKKLVSKNPKAVINSLKKGKTYYVKVRAFKQDSTGKDVYGKYSTVAKIKLKK